MLLLHLPHHLSIPSTNFSSPLFTNQTPQRNSQLMIKSSITTLSKMSTESTARAFFSTPHFAVVGASSDPSKFGHKSISAPFSLNRHPHLSLPFRLPTNSPSLPSLRLVHSPLPPRNAHQPHLHQHNRQLQSLPRRTLALPAPRPESNGREHHHAAESHAEGAGGSKGAGCQECLVAAGDV